MHDYIDTERTDCQEERYWADNFKSVIKAELKQSINRWIDNKKRFFIRAFAESYIADYKSYRHFVGDISSQMIIGAENGADETFEELYGIMITGGNLTGPAKVEEYTDIFPPRTVTRIFDEIRKDYLDEHELEHIYSSHYKKEFAAYDMFINFLASLILNGVIRGTEEAAKAIYRSLCIGEQLPRLKRKVKPIKI